MAKRPNSNIQPCYFLSGQFDECRKGLSCCALLDPFHEVCEQRNHRDSIQSQRMHHGEDKRLLTTNCMVPSLADITGECAVQNDSEHGDKDNFEWNHPCCFSKAFVQAICDEQHPVILFLDDLQWIDDTGFAILEDLITDTGLEHFMFIGAFRSNEVGEDHSLSLAMRRIEQRKPMELFMLDNLSKNAIHKFIAESLCCDEKDCKGLAEVLYRKTNGNIFFLKQTLEMLRRKHVIRRNFATLQWTWDIQNVESTATISDNVIDAILSRLFTLPVMLQTALFIASFMRSTFDVDTLQSLMVQEGHNTSYEDLLKILTLAVGEGLLAISSSKREEYKFTHDRIRQACFSLVPPGPIHDDLCLRLAKHLIERGNSIEGEDWMLFVAADHLNSRADINLEPMELVDLNLKVGKKAVAVAAFVPACAYLESALDAFDRVERPWETHYEIACQLHRSAAEAEFCLGRFERGRDLCNTLINRTQSVVDKLRMKLSLGQAFGKIQRHTEALHVHTEALRLIKQWPCRFHALHIAKDLHYVRTFFKKHSDHDILLLPSMTDETTVLTMDHYSELAVRAYYCGKKDLILLAILKQLKMSILYGVGPNTADALVTFGAVLCGLFHDYEGGRRMTRLAKHILVNSKGLDRLKAKHRECSVLCNSAVFVYVFFVGRSFYFW